MNNYDIADAIASRAIQHRPGLRVEAATFAPYTGAAIVNSNDNDHNRAVIVYICDDDPAAPVWMIDSTDLISGEVNPQPLTGEGLTKALDWLQQA